MAQQDMHHTELELSRYPTVGTQVAEKPNHRDA
jgi:hypothetical protein